MNAYVVHGCLDALVCCISCRVPFVCVSMLLLYISHAFDRIHVIGRFHVFGQIHVFPCDTPHKFSASPYGQTWLEVHLRFVTKPTRHDSLNLSGLSPFRTTVPFHARFRLVPADLFLSFLAGNSSPGSHSLNALDMSACARSLKMPHHQGKPNRICPLPDPGGSPARRLSPPDP